jgi:hypothetical protein
MAAAVPELPSPETAAAEGRFPQAGVPGSKAAGVEKPPPCRIGRFPHRLPTAPSTLPTSCHHEMLLPF